MIGSSRRLHGHSSQFDVPSCSALVCASKLEDEMSLRTRERGHEACGKLCSSSIHTWNGLMPIAWQKALHYTDHIEKGKPLCAFLIPQQVKKAGESCSWMFQGNISSGRHCIGLHIVRRSNSMWPRCLLTNICNYQRIHTMSASLAPECNDVKERYDSCFLKWYSEKYLRGSATTDDCEELFKQYKTCLGKALKDKGIEQMVEEARADNKDNDMEYLRPNVRTK